MKNLIVVILTVFSCVIQATAQYGTLSSLHVHGTELHDEQCNRVVLHGVMDTPSPYFNNGRWGTSASVAYVNKCIQYFNTLYQAITDSDRGTFCNVFRLHLDPCWCFVNGDGESDFESFKKSRFTQFWESLYRPLILNALEYGLYVVVRPPGVCPEEIIVDGAYQEYLTTIWDIVSQDDSIKKYSGYISIELANEPVNIMNANGVLDIKGSSPKDFFQPICDVIRQNGFTGIIWVPGAGYQSIFNGFADYPIEGYNIGYAAHVYPGWYSCSDDSYDADEFIKNFRSMVPVVDTNPIIVTEVDWSPEQEGVGKYNEFGEYVPANYGTWGTASTSKWGSAYKNLIDTYGISMTLTGTADYIDIDEYIDNDNLIPAFQGVNEACGETCWEWYKQYSQQNVAYPEFTKKYSADQGDGTYINPIINADFPDPDVIRVDNTYYMLSTTMHHLPGGTLMKSYDLINWEYVGNPLETLADTPAFNLTQGESAYANGMWASAINYKDGVFYLLLQCNEAGMILLTTTDPENGDWERKKLDTGFYDCGLLFDGDDTYIVSGINHITVSRVDENFNVIESNVVIKRDDAGLEGAKLYHIGQYYYIYATYGGTEGSQTIFRSTTPMGEYEESNDRVFKGQSIHQGALIETQTGEWWTILFKDNGAIGRIPYLEPVTWNSEGWPIIGNDGIDVSNSGNAYTKPNVGCSYPKTYLPTNDTFTNLTLSKQWQWNHQPDNNAWSLTENPGFLRLYTTGIAENLTQARNSLTQRMQTLHNEGTANSKKPTVYGTVKLAINNMKDGDIAGLACYQDPYSYIGIKQEDGIKSLHIYRPAYDNYDEVDYNGGTIDVDTVYLQARANFGTNKVVYYYSTDNENYTRVYSGSFELRYIITVFVGQRFYIFNYATKANGGYVDVDWFTTESDFEETKFYSPESLETPNTDDLKVAQFDVPSEIIVLNGGTTLLPIEATMLSGKTENVASRCTYITSNSDILSINRGVVSGLSEGSTTIKLSYTDYDNITWTGSTEVRVEAFPFLDNLFNPSLDGEGVFDSDEMSFTTSLNGMAGWQYSEGLDASQYKYIVIELAEKPAVTTKFALYSSDASYTRSIVSTTTKITLANTKIDLATIQKAGFITSGGKIYPKSVYLSNDGSTPASINVINRTAEGVESNKTYNLLGQQVPRNYKGIVVINKKKILNK